MNFVVLCDFFGVTRSLVGANAEGETRRDASLNSNICGVWNLWSHLNSGDFRLMKIHKHSFTFSARKSSWKKYMLKSAEWRNFYSCLQSFHFKVFFGLMTPLWGLELKGWIPGVILRWNTNISDLWKLGPQISQKFALNMPGSEYRTCCNPPQKLEKN